MLSPDHRALLNARCDVIVASRGAAMRPSVCWAMGGHVHEDRRTITIWLRRDQAGAVPEDVRANGRVSAVFGVPLTSVSLQVKGHDARVRDALHSDAEILRSYAQNMVRELQLISFPEALARTVFEQPLDALLAITFTVHSVFQQTPGPGAGQAIGSAP